MTDDVLFERELTEALRAIPEAPGRAAIRNRVLSEAVESPRVAAARPIRRTNRWEVIAVIATMAACVLVVWTALTQDDAAQLRALAASLGADDLAERERAEAELLKIGDPAKRAIEEIASSGSAEAKSRATRLLAQLPLREALGPEAGPDFARATAGLDRVDVLVRHRAAVEKLTLGREAGVRVADAILEGYAWRTRYEDAAHQAQLFELGERIKKAKLHALSWVFVRLLEHEHHYVRLHAVTGLQEVDAREHVDLIAPQMDAKDEWLRRYAILAVGRMGGEAHRAKIEAFTKSADRRDRQNAYEALSILGSAKSMQAIEGGLTDVWPGVRSHCALYLDEMQAKEALPALKRALAAERDADVRNTMTAAVRSLETLRGKRVMVDLAHLWMGDDSEIAKPEQVLVRTADEWRALWERHSKKERPEVDFSKHMVIAIFQGDGWNSSGVTPRQLEEDDASIRLRYDEASYQSVGGANRVRAYGLFVVPRSAKPVAIEENVAGLIGQAPVWRERATLR